MHNRTDVMNREIANETKTIFFYQALNMFISAVKLALTYFRSQPQVIIQETDIFGTSTLASFSDPEVAP